MVKSYLPGRIESGASQQARAGGMPHPPEEGSGVARGEPVKLSAQQLRIVIQRKLVAYKHQDAAKGLRFNLKVDHILGLKGGPIEPLVRRATLSCSGLTSQRTHNSSVLTG